ncbi:hypothetical protein [Neorhodopirellula lusitana]|uniref:hypothetical protein n=1 Tax=Neorhodopirellula lusitana TaxID=445327 RepID=UPI00384A4762
MLSRSGMLGTLEKGDLVSGRHSEVTRMWSGMVVAFIQLSLTSILAITVWASPLGCLWDYDTLWQERSRFPDLLELIVGHTPRHSADYYRWRMEARSAIDPDRRTVADFDDLAVAHEKLGEHERANEVITEKIARYPESGRYESEANLGTFLVHAGRYEEGLTHLRSAIEINPDAHFGRERYQIWLVEYLCEQEDPSALPVWPGGSQQCLDYFRTKQAAAWEADPPQAYADTVKGIAGMLRFGNPQSPVLLETLAGLLALPDYTPDLMDVEDSKQLAARALLVASQQVDGSARDAYRERADEVLLMQNGVELTDIERLLATEQKAAANLVARIQQDENTWISDRADVDERFQANYAETPPLPSPAMASLRTRRNAFWVGLIAITGTLLALAIAVVRRRKRKRLKPTSQTV